MASMSGTLLFIVTAAVFCQTLSRAGDTHDDNDGMGGDGGNQDYTDYGSGDGSGSDDGSGEDPYSDLLVLENIVAGLQDGTAKVKAYVDTMRQELGTETILEDKQDRTSVNALAFMDLLIQALDAAIEHLQEKIAALRANRENQLSSVS